MVTRTPAGNAKVLKEQYELLKDAVNGYFAGTEIKAIVAAVHIRTLVHNTDRSDAFLATIDPNFKKLDIYRKRQPSSKAVFWMPVGVQMPSMVISHTAPSEAAREILKDLDGSYFLNKHGDVESRTSRTLQEMFEAHRPSMW
jgi:hypothetical protein